MKDRIIETIVTELCRIVIENIEKDMPASVSFLVAAIIIMFLSIYSLYNRCKIK